MYITWKKDIYLFPIALMDSNPGNFDLAVTNNGDADVSILLGNGDGTFGPKTDFPTGINPGSVAVGLFNAHSNFDLAVINNNDNDVTTAPPIIS